MYLYQWQMQITISKRINGSNTCIVLEESRNPITKAQDKEFCKKQPKETKRKCQICGKHKLRMVR